MSLTAIILILAFGIFLIIIELFLIPGTTFVGIVGALFLIFGIFEAYKNLEIIPASALLVGAILLAGVITKFGLKRLQESEFTVKEKIDSRVNDEDYSFVHPGDEGFTLSDLRPEGYAMIKDRKVVVSSKGEFLNSNSVVEVIKVKDNKIIVKSKSV